MGAQADIIEIIDIYFTFLLHVNHAFLIKSHSRFHIEILFLKT
jgi:hypothetical protein